ncbi:rod shape-determining protein MreC [Nocardioides zeae]|uniref:Cell shape-determining protein MreC n=1 Tax=Nocardioides zeae TaxID=1457234 RepID=A0AAJ1TZ80_9ACTN|nr:rod shape-determining protein MreC [Nocardioides zeae]MDQ1105091.1 rod shape-determining protein MreC [Nocardioides zeae]
MALRTPLPPSGPDTGGPGGPVGPGDRTPRPGKDDRLGRTGRPRGLARLRRLPLTVSWAPGEAQERRPPRALVAALAITGLSLMTLDYLGGDSSPVEPARTVVGEVVGPLETVADAVVRPVAAVPAWFRTQSSLRDQLATAEAENAELENRLATDPLDRARLAEYDGLLTAAAAQQVDLVPARVVAYGAAQTFTRTVTIDAGTSSGVQPDMTVIAPAGLVGRVVGVTRTTATVLLVVDADSTVGARVGSSNEVGFLSGGGSLSEPSRLDLDLVDTTVVPAEGDVVATWGSGNAGPYVAGVPIGTVTELFSTPRDTTKRAVIKPFVDFSRLDTVGVVVPPDTESDRALIGPDGIRR